MLSESSDGPPPPAVAAGGAAEKRPADVEFSQQKLPAWQPLIGPEAALVILFVLGVIFVPTGVVLMGQAEDVIEHTKEYDGSHGADTSECSINKHTVGSTCNVSFHLSEKMREPIYVYYELHNFYQNHRRYVASYASEQLRGKRSGLTKSNVKSSCDPLVENKTSGDLLYPCGLIANTFFNDVITLDSVTLSNGSQLHGVDMLEHDIAWDADVNHKFHQPTGFEYFELKNGTNCTAQAAAKGYSGEFTEYEEDGVDYCFHYPKDSQIQYLYETYPGVISPLDGVTDEHFIVWMRVAGLPNFRKLYGKIKTDLPKGSTVTFSIVANFLVNEFDGSKSLIMSTVSWYGGHNPFIGRALLAMGIIFLVADLFILAKYLISPKKLGDPAYMRMKQD